MVLAGILSKNLVQDEGKLLLDLQEPRLETVPANLWEFIVEDPLDR